MAEATGRIRSLRRAWTEDTSIRQLLPSMDALVALGKVLELVSTSDAPLSQLVGSLPVAHLRHVQADCPWDMKGTVMRKMTEKSARWTRVSG